MAICRSTLVSKQMQNKAKKRKQKKKLENKRNLKWRECDENEHNDNSSNKGKEREVRPFQLLFWSHVFEFFSWEKGLSRNVYTLTEFSLFLAAAAAADATDAVPDASFFPAFF